MHEKVRKDQSLAGCERGLRAQWTQGAECRLGAQLQARRVPGSLHGRGGLWAVFGGWEALLGELLVSQNCGCSKHSSSVAPLGNRGSNQWFRFWLL